MTRSLKAARLIGFALVAATLALAGCLDEGPGGSIEDPWLLPPPGESNATMFGTRTDLDFSKMTPDEAVSKLLDGNKPLKVLLPEPSNCGIDVPTLPTVPFKPQCSASKYNSKALIGDSTARKDPLHEPWLTGRSIAVHAGTIYVADRDNGELARIEETTHKILKPIALGNQPDRIVIGPSGQLFVTLKTGAAVGVGKTSQLEQMQTWNVGKGPSDLALTQDASTLLVALQDENRVTMLNAQTGIEIATAPTLHQPRAIAVNGEGTVIVSHIGAKVRTFDLTTDATGGLILGYGNTSTASLAIGNMSSLSIFTATGMAPPGTNDVPGRAFAIDVDPETGSFFVAHTVAHPGRKEDATSVARLSGTAAGKVSPDPETDPVPPYYGAGIGGSGGFRPLEPELTRLSSTGKANWKVGSGFFTSQIASVEAKDSSDVASHPTRRFVFMAMAGTDNILVTDPKGAADYSGNLHTVFLGTIPVGQNPVGIAFTGDGSFAYVHNAQSHSISVIELKLIRRSGGISNGVLGCPTVEVPFAKSKLTAAATAGRRVFTHAGNKKLSFLGDLACSSCHPDGGDDGQKWLGSTGIRQTPALGGRMVGTAPFNWAGGASSLTQNMQMTVHRMRGKGLCKEELGWLKKYIEETLELPPNPNVAADGKLTAQQLQGKKLFERSDVGCSGCHAPGSGTNGQSYDVGTTTKTDLAVATTLAERVVLKSTGTVFAAAHKKHYEAIFDTFRNRITDLDTPSLKGVWATAPYLHDGSAATLEGVLARTAGKMGDITMLNSTQKAALVAYLKTL